mgnify:CR=1 FL=1
MNFKSELEEAMEFLDERTELHVEEFTEYVFGGDKKLETIKGHKYFEDIKYTLDLARKDYLDQNDLPDNIEEKVYNALLKNKYINLDEEREKEQERQDNIWKTDRAYLERKSELEDKL